MALVIFLPTSNVCVSDLCMTSHPELWGTGGCWEELGYPEHAAWEGKVAATKLDLSSLGKSLEDSQWWWWWWGAEKESVGFTVVSYKGTPRFPEPLLSLFKALPLHSHRNPGAIPDQGTH